MKKFETPELEFKEDSSFTTVSDDELSKLDALMEKKIRENTIPITTDLKNVIFKN